MAGVCGWRVRQEGGWPYQWIGMCERNGCDGGIRCNDRATAEQFKDFRLTCVAVDQP